MKYKNLLDAVRKLNAMQNKAEKSISVSGVDSLIPKKEVTVSKNSYAALSFLKSKSAWITTADMAKALCFSPRTAKDWALELYRAGAVERRWYARGRSRGYEYKYLTEAGITPRDNGKTRVRARVDQRVLDCIASGEKHCSRCKQVKPLNSFEKRPTGSYGSLCKECRRKKWSCWRERNAEGYRYKSAARSRDRYALKKEKINSGRREQRAQLDDSYVASLLFPRGQLSKIGAPIPQSLIEAKRANVLIKRILKEKKESL